MFFFKSIQGGKQAKNHASQSDIDCLLKNIPVPKKTTIDTKCKCTYLLVEIMTVDQRQLGTNRHFQPPQVESHDV